MADLDTFSSITSVLIAAATLVHVSFTRRGVLPNRVQRTYACDCGVDETAGPEGVLLSNLNRDKVKVRSNLRHGFIQYHLYTVCIYTCMDNTVVVNGCHHRRLSPPCFTHTALDHTYHPF